MRHGSRVRRKCLVNDPLRHLEITTNGTHKVTDHEPAEPRHEGAPPLNAQSVDERLEALMETIRTWDWRAASVRADLRPTDESVSSASAAATTAIAEVRADSEPVTKVASPIENGADTQSVVLEQTRPVTDPTVPTYPTAVTPTVVPKAPPRSVADPAVPTYPTAVTPTVVPEAPPRPFTDPAVPTYPTAVTPTVVPEAPPRPVTDTAVPAYPTAVTPALVPDLAPRPVTDAAVPPHPRRLPNSRSRGGAPAHPV